MLDALAIIGALALIWWIARALTADGPNAVPISTTRAARGGASRDFATAVAAELDAPVVPGNAVRTLVNGDQIFPAMLQSIREARVSINFLSYIYWRGRIATEFSEALSAAAGRGLEVRVLVDTYGSRWIEAELLERMREAGCRVAYFRPIRWHTLRRLNNRTHRRVLVVDGERGYTGGVGIASEWEGDARGPGEWRDTHFELRGPIVRYLQGAFAENWRQASGEVLVSETAYPELEPAGSSLIVPLATRPGDRLPPVALLYWLSLRKARRRVDIATPYLVPTDWLVRELIATARRGVEVRILVPGRHNDSRLVRYASQALYPRLIRAGVRIFEYQPTMMHSKTLTVDDDWTVIGTANFDHRSFELNYETTFAVVDPELVRCLDATYTADLDRAREITDERLRRWSWVRRLRNRLTYQLREQL